MALKLSDREIHKRLTEWRNYKRLYPELKQKYEQAKKRIKELEDALRRERKEREESVETLKLQIEELREMVFGRKKSGSDTDDQEKGCLPKNHSRNKAKERSPSSYRRPTPSDDEVTKENHYSIDSCPDCDEPLCNLKEAVRYLEDIILPAFQGKTVEKQHIETGFLHERGQH